MIQIQSANSTRETRPATRPQPSPQPLEPTSLAPSSDRVQLSSEASEYAEVDASRCQNDWRCLEQLQQRGLLS